MLPARYDDDDDDRLSINVIPHIKECIFLFRQWPCQLGLQNKPTAPTSILDMTINNLIGSSNTGA